MGMKDDVAAAKARLARPIDFAGATVVGERKPSTVAHSTRLPPEYSQELEDEAERLDTNPSKLMQDIVIEWLKARRQAPVVTVNIADLHRALDAALLHPGDAA